MKILLDTHVWLWWLAGSSRIRSSTRELLDNENNHVYLSIASAWEITIKYALGKIALPVPPSEYIKPRLAAQKIQTLDISLEHACYVEKLPHHHNDPFDRILIAQTLLENMVFVTADVAIVAYNLPSLELL